MRRVAIIGAIVAAFVLATIVASCTIFDGLTATAVDGGSVSDAATVDAGGDSAASSLPGFLSLADGVAFCSNVFACPLLGESVEFSIDVPVESTHFSACVDWVSGPLPSNRVGHDDTAKYLKCAADAKTCTAAGGCLWYEIIDPSDPRCKNNDAGAKGSCEEDGGALYFCSTQSIEHCNNTYYPAGFSCLPGKDGALYCAGPTCTGDQCSGGFLQFCGSSSMILAGYDCNVGGFTCGFDGTEGYNDCLTDGVAKTCNSLSVTCQGNSVTLCDGEYQSQYDCNASGGTCDQSAFPRCKRPGETCTALDSDVDVCAGSSITMCVGGQQTTFDCASIGKTCVPAGGAQSAHCL